MATFLRNTLSLFVAALILAMSLSCSACDRRAQSINAKPLAVCTTGLVADLVRAIGGSRIEVRALMGPGVDPHLYKASPSDVRQLESARIIFASGLHLEGRMGEALESMGSRVRVVMIGEAIPNERLRSLGEPGGKEALHDPHVWFDASLWSLCAAKVRDELITIDPAGRAEYETRATTLLASMEKLHDWTRAELARVPKAQRVLVTAHDAFNYFGRAYDVEVLAVQGVSTDSEAGLRDINRLVDTITARKIAAVFVESSVPRKTVEALVEGCKARGHDLRIGGELYSDALGPVGSGADNYDGMVRANVSTIVNALLGNATGKATEGKP